jgi:hypothetical protein
MTIETSKEKQRCTMMSRGRGKGHTSRIVIRTLICALSSPKDECRNIYVAAHDIKRSRKILREMIKVLDVLRVDYSVDLRAVILDLPYSRVIFR